MGIELYWDNDEQTVMLCEFGARWTWEEMFSTLDTIKKATQKRAEEIGAIIDLSEGIHIPGGSLFSFEAREKGMKMLRMSSSGKGPLVIVGGGGFFKTLMGAFQMLSADAKLANDVYFANSVDEARAMMARRLRAGAAIPA
ncbi:hypothetical protein HC928_21400 [bacterium]|nr:hypothetical protein [bacterium]